jgi:hypothetical protein
MHHFLAGGFSYCPGSVVCDIGQVSQHPQFVHHRGRERLLGDLQHLPDVRRQVV